jgi:ferritin-like metal-binding protein YciE
MGIFTATELNSLQDLLSDEIQDIYDAEKRLTAALPKMAEAARSPELRAAFQEHQRQTEDHVNRLEQVFELLGETPERDTCDAMKGLIDEGEEVVSARGSDEVRDAALIAAAQRVEHYEIASYGCAREFAEQLGQEEVSALLQQTLEEEKSADKRLTAIARSSVNPQAQ